MKNTIFAFVMILGSSTAFAVQSIELAPGSKILISAGQSAEVSCSGTSTSSGRCKLNKDRWGSFLVLVDDQTMTSHSSIDSALETLEKMKNAGICF